MNTIYVLNRSCCHCMGCPGCSLRIDDDEHSPKSAPKNLSCTNFTHHTSSNHDAYICEQWCSRYIIPLNPPESLWVKQRIRRRRRMTPLLTFFADHTQWMYACVPPKCVCQNGLCLCIRCVCWHSITYMIGQPNKSTCEYARAFMSVYGQFDYTWRPSQGFGERFDVSMNLCLHHMFIIYYDIVIHSIWRHISLDPTHICW